MTIRKDTHTLHRRDFLKRAIYTGLASGIANKALFAGGAKKKSIQPNIILITLDTTRADRLGCYGYERNTSPNIDKIAAESVLYKKAIATSSWTLPSHASLFTGKFSSSHGATYDPNGPLRLLDAIEGPKEWNVFRARGLSQNELTLAQILKNAGYKTGAVAGGPWLKRVFGLDKGFDFYDDTEIGTLNGRLARQVTASAINFLEKVKGDNFFLFLNYFDAHSPYNPPEGFAKAFLPKGTELPIQYPSINQSNCLYDAEILYMDHYIGQLFEQLKKDKLYENTFIIITSDHGELLGEHGKFGHGLYLYQQELHIPLLLKYPGSEVSPVEKNDIVQLIDVFALILERIDIKVPAGTQAGLPPDIGHPVLAETYPLPIITKAGQWRAMFEKDYKFIWNSKNNHLLFNLKNNPEENKNLFRRNKYKVNIMLARLDKYISALPKPGPADPAKEIDQETMKALKSLGYVR